MKINIYGGGSNLQIYYYLEDMILLFLFVGVGLLFGIVGWRKKQYAKMYGGFGHFIGVIISGLLTYDVSREDSSKGIAIMILYPLFAGGGWLIGLFIGKAKDRQSSKHM
ncbi:hypothetical protein [Neobacillus vireti]|uniref:hypothetical protein n=1 Tax=Neobacillus vireti TaxID=220686 RepID=UPI0030002D05